MLLGRVKIDTSGIDALLSEAKKRNITLKGARAAGRILREAARSEAPKRSGATKAAQAVKAAKGTQGTTSSYAVQGVRKKYEKQYTPPGRNKSQRVVPAFIDHLIQLGTRAHSIAKGASLARRGKSGSDKVQVGKKHPGARPNPYRERAWQAVKGDAGRAATQAMGEATQKEIAKRAAKIAADARKKR